MRQELCGYYGLRRLVLALGQGKEAVKDNGLSTETAAEVLEKAASQQTSNYV